MSRDKAFDVPNMVELPDGSWMDPAAVERITPLSGDDGRGERITLYAPKEKAVLTIHLKDGTTAKQWVKTLQQQFSVCLQARTERDQILLQEEIKLAQLELETARLKKQEAMPPC
jgi:hypothetical protein